MSTINQHIYLVSDSTGETVSTVARSIYARFENINFLENKWALIRTEKQIDNIINILKDKKYVINDVIAFKKVLADGEFSENETFKNFMNIMTEMRQQHSHKGPCKEWILASTIEAVCQMYFLDKELALEFLANSIFVILSTTSSFFLLDIHLP